MGRIEGLDCVGGVCNQTFVATRQVNALEHDGLNFTLYFFGQMIGHLGVICAKKPHPGRQTILVEERTCPGQRFLLNIEAENVAFGANASG